MTTGLKNGAARTVEAFKTTRSASFPSVMEPILVSKPIALAPFIVAILIESLAESAFGFLYFNAVVASRPISPKRYIYAHVKHFSYPSNTLSTFHLAVYIYIYINSIFLQNNQIVVASKCDVSRKYMLVQKSDAL